MAKGRLACKNNYNLKKDNRKRDNMKQTLFSTKAPKPAGPYSQAVKAGKFLFVSGQLPIDPEEGKIVAMDIASQTRQVMENTSYSSCNTPLSNYQE
jgi:hypothetical protein